MNKNSKIRWRIVIQGIVQGVGFRPFIYRLANEMDINGWVQNSPQGVVIEAEAQPQILREFVDRVRVEAPRVSRIDRLDTAIIANVADNGFRIVPSESGGQVDALILPDLATCNDCLREIFDPIDRRYLYPFTSCIHCGPRYSILTALPYDRGHTTMDDFAMCDLCHEEYQDPYSRRFHCQPNACPACGPQLAMRDGMGKTTALSHESLLQAAEAIRHGYVVAVKGLGGFHLVADAANTCAIAQIRQLKSRRDKPLALMYPSLDLIEEHCFVGTVERELLCSREAPIVLLQRKSLAAKVICQTIAPGNPYLGVMLPYTPLHHLLMSELASPIVATSGNFRGETLCIEEGEARDKFRGSINHFLVHNRRIAQHVDDSIVQVVAQRPQIIRHARGYAPLSLRASTDHKQDSLLAVGPQNKNSIALSTGGAIFLSQHIGDLDDTRTQQTFCSAVEYWQKLYQAPAKAIVCDAHPDYFSTLFANNESLPVIPVQHHYAHALACMAEHQLAAPVLGVVWDGTGYGEDGTIWGGEFLLIEEHSFRRIGHLRSFLLAGGDKAVYQPRRSAAGILYEIFGDSLFSRVPEFAQHFPQNQHQIIKTMLTKRINTIYTSSAGRMFDAIASLLGIRQYVEFEGQAAMELQFAAAMQEDAIYPFQLKNARQIVVDWQPMICKILEELQNSVDYRLIASRFHNTLAAMIVAVALRLDIKHIVLSGGCFQNKYLSERTIECLQKKGFSPYWQQRIPPNDGGIALGQIIAAQRSWQCASQSQEKSCASTTVIR